MQLDRSAMRRSCAATAFWGFEVGISSDWDGDVKLGALGGFWIRNCQIYSEGNALCVERLRWVIIDFLLVCGNLGVNLQADGAESDLSGEEDDSLATHGVL